MTLVQMRYFLEVCRQETVTRAAEVLHVTQPSVSSAIRELEEEFGIRLFHRVKMRLSLTREGELFREQCAGILAESDRLADQMKDLGVRRHSIRIGVPPMIGTFLFPSIFEGFHSAYPNVELELAEHGSRKIREMVSAEELDIAIAIADPKKDLQFHAIPIFNTQLLFSVDRAHPMAGRATIRLEELDGQSLILFQQDSFQTMVLTQQFAQMGIHPRVLLSSSQLYTIKKIIAGGKAGAFLFREVAAQEPDIVGIPLEEPIAMEICLIWKRGQRMYSDTMQFIGFVQQLF